jgi:hypothetical protein
MSSTTPTESALRRQSSTAAERPPSTVDEAVESHEPIVDLGKVLDEVRSTQPIEFRVTFARPDDLLVCDFLFDNLRLDGTELVRSDPARVATLIVELPPQSFGEQAFLDATGPEVPSKPTGNESFKEVSQDPSIASPKNDATMSAEPLDPLPCARIRMAGRSRIAFAMPAAEKKLAFTLDAILDACRRWPMQLDANAVPEPEPSFLRESTMENIAEFNQAWLEVTAQSDDLKKATQTLIDAVGGAELEPLLAEAAERLASQGALRSAGAELERAMNEELDALTRAFAPLREGNQREIALAALALMTTQAVAKSPAGGLTLPGVNPLLKVVFAPRKPSPTVTALELPYRVITSPIPQATWWHATKPVVHNGRTELWHTRLTRTTDGAGADPPAQVRALWSPDYELSQAEVVQVVNSLNPFRMSLDPLDRQMMVKLMAGFFEKTVDQHVFVPRAARSQRLALSALGALFDVEGNWEVQPAGVGLEQWRHLATLGRDHYVRVVYRGFLFPYGHAASLIKVTERKFEYRDKVRMKDRVAVLRQRFFIVVRERVRQLSGEGHAFGGRNFPFTSVEILTRVTPSLLAPDKCTLSDQKIYNTRPKRACFWPMLAADRDFLFQVAATDLGGTRVTFAMPLLFVGVEANQVVIENQQKDDVIPEIIACYNGESSSRRTATLGNATVCYAPTAPGAEGDPRLPTAEMTFAAAAADLPESKPRFYPETETAQVGIPAIRRLLQRPDATVGVAYPEVYKNEGFTGGNPAEVFLRTLQPFELAFGENLKSDTIGGLATPSMQIQGLSRLVGPVAAKPGAKPDDTEAALDQVIHNTFDPADFFQGAKILGGVDLSELLAVAKLEDAPKLLSRQLPDKVEASFDWSSSINQSSDLFVANAGGATTLKMHGVVSSPIAQPEATTFSAVASIDNFKVNLFGLVTIWFESLSFTSKSGSKPDVAVDLHPGEDAIAFGGPLEFINTLRDIIPSNGFSDPPSLAVTPSGISASYSLNVPSLAVGIFALEHVSLGAGFLLPFDARPAEVRFHFSERQAPFSLTVSMLGGGGFFALGIGTEGVREIEAALEFGACLALDLGVASGSVEVKAGIYFHWLQTTVELAGYIRMHGELSVLGLISASLTFNLQLAYLKENHCSVIWGEATVEVEVEVLFLSFSVSVKCRRELGGSNSDPKFIELIPDLSTWTDYCDAFAAEAA